jgi:tripartite-type tricarboxylate transporter receptor subunit TctC
MKQTPLKRIAAMLAVLLAALTVLAGVGRAADYPDRPIKLVVPYTPGGSADVLARALADGLGKELGQAVVVENKPGANTMIAAQAVARAQGDGYTLLLSSSASMVLNPLLYRKINYDARKDFQILSVLAEVPLVVVTNQQVPARNLKAFADYAKQQKGALNYGSVGLGNPLQVATEMLKDELNVEIAHVPYNGSAPALAALLANDTQLMVDVVGTSVPHIRGGKLKALAVTGSERHKQLPDVPTVAESGYPGFRAATWFGIAAPAATSPAVAAKIQAAAAKASASPPFRAVLDAQGLVPQPPRSNADIAQYVERDRTGWEKVIQARGIRLE